MLFINLLLKLTTSLGTTSRRTLFLGLLGFLPVLAGGSLILSHPHNRLTSPDDQRAGAVLAADTVNPDFQFNVNVPSNFAANSLFEKDVSVNGDLNVKGKAVFSEGLSLSGQNVDLGAGTITASNIIYAVTVGSGLGISSGQTPTITNNGVLSLQGKSGALDLTAGDGITIEGLKISAAAAATQNTFRNVAVSGADTLTATSGSDTLTFAAGSGITLTTDPTTKKVTIGSGGGTASGVTSLNGGTGDVTLNNATISGSGITIDNASTTSKGIASFNNNNFTTTNGAVNTVQDIGIGATPTYAGLNSTGSISINGTQIIDSSRNVSNVGQVNTNLTPGTNNTYDLGSASNQWNNIYGQNLYLAGNLVTTGDPSSGNGSVATFTSSGSAVLRIADNDVFFGGRTTMKTDDTNLANTVDVFAYDTGKDIDGGKWVKSDRIQSTSWYGETVDHTNETCLLASDDRCGSKAFPQKASIVLTSTTLYVFDTLDNTMWMKFTRGTGQAFSGGSVSLTSVYALNGVIYVGTSTNGLIAIDLINDQIYQYDYNGGSGGRATFKGNIAARNTNKTYSPRESWGQISADKVNGVTARLLRGKLYVVASTLTGASVINVTDHRVIRYIDN